MPQNYLTDDFNRNTRPGSICGSMPPKIMRSQLNSSQLACLLYNKSCSCLSYREYPLAGLDAIIPDIFAEPICDSPGDEYHFRFISAFRLPQNKFLVVHVLRGEFKDLSDSHTTPGHQFENKPVSHFCCSEDDRVNRFLLYNVPVVRLSRAVQFPKHWRVTGVSKGRIEVDPDEIEECFQVGIPPVLGLLFCSFGYFAQKRKNLIGADPIQLARVSEMFTEL